MANVPDVLFSMSLYGNEGNYEQKVNNRYDNRIRCEKIKQKLIIFDSKMSFIMNVKLNRKEKYAPRLSQYHQITD